MDLNLLTQFGVAGLMFGGFMFLLKWVLKLKEKILNDASAERACFLTVIKDFQRILDNTVQALKAQQEESKAYIAKAHADHERIMQSCTEACNSLKEFRRENSERGVIFQKEHERMMLHLDEMYKVLLRVNGEKHREA